MKFQIDAVATLGSILKALRTEGVKIGDVAKAIPNISEKPLRNAIKEAGYAFSNKSPKGWHYVGSDVEPIDRSIFDYVKSNSSNVKRTSQEIHTEFIPGNTEFTSSNKKVSNDNTEFIQSSPVVHPQFTKDEVSMLMEMLYEWQQKKAEEQQGKINVSNQVHERIKQLPKDDKTRKTIVIDKNIGDCLDKYCEAERVNKSDVLHLALLDFFKNN
ncbi:hypothetical protein [Streptomyces sp. NPDC048275]|uniref:hypothetical protein n=1 Tax=Bacillati TaxID=1783272 RepID=UPI0033CB2B7D